MIHSRYSNNLKGHLWLPTHDHNLFTGCALHPIRPGMVCDRIIGNQSVIREIIL